MVVGTCGQEKAGQRSFERNESAPEKQRAAAGGDRKKSAGGGYEAVHGVTDWCRDEASSCTNRASTR
eukprot:13881206-Heterocapsa_arctica.AAC.1